MNTHVWSGNQFLYYPKNTVEWPDESGVYVFAKAVYSTPGSMLAESPEWEALYIGETGSFSTRLTPNHEQWSSAEALGFTHIHIHRANILLSVLTQNTMINEYKPFLNSQGKG